MAPLDPLAGMSPKTGTRAVQTSALKDLVRKQLDLSSDTAVFIAEITCGETDCPDLETVIAIFVDGGRREFRINKGVAEIKGSDIAAALSGLARHSCCSGAAE